MFIDFSLKKLLPVVALVTSLGISVATFIFADKSFAIVENSSNFASRTENNLFYNLIYKTLTKGGLFAAAADSASPAKSAGTAQSTTTANAIPVLLYHGTPSEGNNNTPLPQKVFVEQMQALKAAGWQTITLEQFTNFMKSGKPVPAKSFLLTFDDGRKESFYPADPVLKDLGFNAVMFVITGFSLPDSGKNSTFYLSKSELDYMAQSGRWELESHGDEDHRLYSVPGPVAVNGVLPTLQGGHFLSDKFWLPNESRVETDTEFSARVANDLATSKKTLENDFGKPVTAFAFPFNDYGQNTLNFPNAIDLLSGEVKKLYTFAFYQINEHKDDIFNYPDPNTYMIKRLEPLASWSGPDMVSILESADAKTLPYRSKNLGTEWIGNWGQALPQNGALKLSATASTTGAVALLSGSDLWQNYNFTAKIDWQSGSDISLIARYQGDSSNFLTCAFSKNRMALEGHKNGEQETIAASPYDFAGNKNAASFSMSVSGDTVSCTGYGQTVSAKVNSVFVHNGSMGIQIWDKQENLASAIVHEVLANEI